ncbi:MAG TPA: hypothetical protein VLA29_01400 [Acidimicrobiia bacterium]|nr:hypothetical protein [Acidimicrobiia bacterium]
MSRNTSNGSDGSDGSWFLEAVGARKKAATPIEAVAELEEENTRTQDVIAGAPEPARTMAMTFDGDPGTSTSSFAPVPVVPRPPDLSVRLDAVVTTREPGASDATAAGSRVVDGDLPPILRSRRNFRWPVVIALFLIIAGIGAAALWLPRSVELQAASIRQGYYDSASELRNYLPTAQGALDTITNPATEEAAISGSVPLIAEFASVGLGLQAATAEPLPTILPLVPSGPIDDLAPLRFTGSVLGASGSDLAGRLGDAYVYRTTIPLLLQTGPLPLSATTQELNEVSVRLAGSLAENAGAVADLPEDPTLDAVALLARESVARYADWQDEYLGALASGDTEATEVLVIEIDTLRSTLEAATEDALLVVRTEVDNRIVVLAGDLEVYMEDLSRP